MYRFGELFRLTLGGESHGTGIVVMVEGVPAGIPVQEADFADALLRRRPRRVGETGRIEPDAVEVLTGVNGGRTTGLPITVLVRNTNTRSEDYADFRLHPRPGHADYAALRKWGLHADLRGGGMASGRMTVGLVIAGVLARGVLPGVSVECLVDEVGGRSDWENSLQSAVQDGDSLGAMLSCRVTGVPAGMGDPFFDSLESLLAHALFSIPGVKGLEFGSGFTMARLRGSESNDRFVNARGVCSSNHNGGIAGGISTGQDIVLRLAVRAPASIGQPQMTFHAGAGDVLPLRVGGRHDACFALRVPVVVESMVSLVLADLALRRQAELHAGAPVWGQNCTALGWEP